MIPVVVVVEFLAREKVDRFKSELGSELRALGIDALQIEVNSSHCESGGCAFTVEGSGLLHLAEVPVDERRRRVESTVRAALQTAGLNPAMEVEVDIGWDRLRSTELLPSDLTAELDATIAELEGYSDGSEGADWPAFVSQVSKVQNEPPQAAIKYDISHPVFNRLVRHRLRELGQN